MSRVRANTINKSGDGGPDFPNGFTANSGSVTGILTATSYDIDDLNVGSAATMHLLLLHLNQPRLVH